MNESKLPEQCEKIIERLYVFVDTKDMQQNRRLNLVVNPEIIKILINQAASQCSSVKINVVKIIANIFASNSFNSLILAKRDRQIMEFNHSILQSLINFIFSIREYKSAQQLANYIIPFIHSYPINSKIIKTVLSIITKDFYYEKLDNKMLQLSIKVLHKIITHQRFKQGQPNSYFITYGEQTGIKMINRSIKWPFSKGFHVYMKFYMQNTTEDDMVIFNLAVQNDQFVVFITEEGQLRIKIFSQQQPLYIAFIPAKQWVTLALSYTLKSKLLKNYYQIHCLIDGQMHERRDLPVPQSVGMSDEITQLSIGRNFYGLIHNFLLSRNQITQWNKLILNNWSEIQSFLVINKKIIRQLFVFYHPLLITCINQKEIVYDITSQNHGQVFENTGIYVNPFKTVDFTYYGGLYTFLPFLHILKFYSFKSYQQALTNIFQLYFSFFQNGFGNVEAEAINCQFFSIATQLINELDHRFINRQFITIIFKMSNRITNMLLKKDFLVGFLWRLNTKKIQDPQIIQNLFEIIERFYLQFFEWSYSNFSLDDIFHYIIDNFEPSNINQCCFSHFAHFQGGQTVDPIKFSVNFAAKTKTIKNILKLVFVNLTNFQSIRPIKVQVMQILFGSYSPCLKLLLLQSLSQGVKANANFYIRQLNILNYMYIFLSKTQLPDQLAAVFQIFLSCLQHDDENQLLTNNIIYRIAICLDNIYKKHYDEVRFRSKTDKLTSLRLKNNQRNYSEQKIVQEKTKRLQKKLIRGSPLQTHKGLYEVIIKICFYYDKGEEDCLLKHDDFVLILQPYFKICCINYRKNIINMIRNTIILAANGKSILDNLTKFDRLYKLLLNQFVLKELQPNNPDYLPNQQTNYIIRNVYFVIDYMIMGIRNDWGHLYHYLLRILGFLEQIKRDIHKRTNRTPEDINFAVKVTLRKFVLRVIKLAEKDVHNLANLVFLVYLMVFGNQNIPKQIKMFRYYQSFQQNLFVGGYSIVSSETVASKQQISFVDSKLILQTASSFRIHSIDIRKMTSIKITNFINSYLDIQYTTEQSQLYKNRFMYLSTAEFKVLKPSEGTLQSILAGFLGEQSHQKVSIGQIFSIMLGLCIQSAISTRNTVLLNDSLRQLQIFSTQFLLLSSRDGLRLRNHLQRNKQLPKSIIFSVLHFLYATLDMNNDSNVKSVISETIYCIFNYMALLINCLYDKLGRPENIERSLQLSKVQCQVEQYNFFTFQMIRQIFKLKQIMSIPNIEKQKAIQLIFSEKVITYFKNTPKFALQKKVQETTSIHKMNAVIIKKQIEQRFIDNFVISQVPSEYLLNPTHFQKVFVFQYQKANNLNYRRIQRIWRKIWKRLRVYHYFWSVGMNQRQSMKIQFQKNYTAPFRHKFSKFVDQNGVRSILEIQPIEPWHVKKVLMQKQFQYRNSNYLYNMHHQQTQTREMSILQKLLTKSKDHFFVVWIKNNSKRKGYLSLQQEKLKFRYISTYQKDSHLQFTSFILAEHKPIEKFWPLVEIVSILQRRYLTLKQCLLIQFQDHTSLIFNFINNDKQEFLNLLQEKQNQKSDKIGLLRLNKVAFYTQKFVYSPSAAIQELNSQWKNNKISNFKYLNKLNKYAGRSYLDPANYPVFPWIISSYDSLQFKYRDLSKSIGALGNQQLIQHYRSKTQSIDPFDPVPPYQYGTHYSSPGMVFNFLIRLQPYTEASRTLQGGKFDLSDRLFNSIKICWQSVTSEVSDVRQLIPQFFYLPEFLLNIQQHNFGLTQMKQRVHNVHLPVWAKNAFDFISIHRNQLQSAQISEHLNQWIDLIFGYKQKGKIAEDNLNLFYYLTYQNSIDLKQIEDPQVKISKQAQIMHFGQTPSQIFTKPHPSKNKMNQKYLRNFKKIKLPLCLQGSGDLTLLYLKDSKLAVFHEYSVKIYSQSNNYNLISQTKLLRNNSKQNIFFIQDIDFYQKIIVFGNNQFVAIGSYINGDLVIYSLSTGKKIEQKKGSPRNCIFVNSDENLLFSGGKNGLLQVFQIIYGEKQTITLIKIAFQYYQSPIYSISQGGNFYVVSSGSLVAVIKISRSLTYVYDKIKMRGIKMIRSFEANRNVDGAVLSPEPLFCVVFFNPMQICSYSINGQFLKSKQTQIIVAPQKIKGDNFSDLIVTIQGSKIFIYTTPFLEILRTVNLPNKIFKEMRFFDEKCYLSTNQGQILCLVDGENDQNQ